MEKIKWIVEVYVFRGDKWFLDWISDFTVEEHWYLVLRIKDESETGPAADSFVGEEPWRTVVDGTTTVEEKYV